MRKRSKRRSQRAASSLRGAVALPRGISQSLEALSKRVLHVTWAEGLLWMAGGFCVLILVQGTLDWLLDLPPGIRAILLFADLLLIAFVVFRFGILPWRNRLTPEESALVAERHWPHLQTGLISAVQLANHPDGSISLIKAMMEKLVPRLRPLDLRSAIPWNRLKHLFLTVTLLALLTAGVATALGSKSFILLQRILVANVPLPTQTIVVAVSENLSVPAGRSIELVAKASGFVPKSGRVEVTYSGKAPEMVPVSPKASTPDLFSLELANVQQPLTYRFFLNDGKGETFQVELLHPPTMEEIRFDVVQPAYTGISPAQLAPGSLTLLAGSKLTVFGKSSQPLKGARLLLTGMNQSMDLKPEGPDRREFRAEVNIPREGLDGIQVELTNDQGITSQNNTVYAVQIVPDTPPEITVARSQPENLNVVPDQKPRLQFSVRDDFKVTQVILCVQSNNALGEGEEPNPDNAKHISIPLPVPAAGLDFNYEWADPEKSVDWAEGTTLTYWIKAIDNNDVTGPGIAFSAPRQWSVVSLQTKREELAEQLRKHAESIKDLSGAQDSLKAEMGDLLKLENEK